MISAFQFPVSQRTERGKEAELQNSHLPRDLGRATFRLDQPRSRAIPGALHSHPPGHSNPPVVTLRVDAIPSLVPGQRENSAFLSERRAAPAIPKCRSQIPEQCWPSAGHQPVYTAPPGCAWQRTRQSRARACLESSCSANTWGCLRRQRTSLESYQETRWGLSGERWADREGVPCTKHSSF